MTDQQISFRIPKGRLVLYESEIMQLLRGRPDLLEVALRRGKPAMRAEREQGRRAK